MNGPKKAATAKQLNNMQPDSDRLLFQSTAERNKNRLPDSNNAAPNRPRWILFCFLVLFCFFFYA